jgi:integrase
LKGLTMPKTTLTDVAVRRLKPPKTGQVDYWDQALGGFGLRIGANGKRTFNVQLRVMVSGKKKDVRIKIGSYPAMALAEARATALDYKTLAAQGKDPRQTKVDAERRLIIKSSNTFATVRERFLVEYGEEHLKDSSLRNYRRALEGDDFKGWEARPVSDITGRDVRTLIGAVKARAPTMSNRTLAYLRKMMGWAVEQEIIAVSPCAGVRAIAKEIKRDRILTDDEIQAVWSAFGSAGVEFEVPYKLMLLLGQRESEIIGMRRSELTTWAEFLGPEIGAAEYRGISGDEPVWVIPRERTKGDRENIVPLPPLAQGLIQMVEGNGSDILFASARAISKAKAENRDVRPLSGFSRSKARIDAASGVSDWRLHDLRRTLRSGLARLRIPSEVARKVVNHKLSGMDDIYDRYQYLPERRSALFSWNNLVDVIVNKTERGNVTDLAKGREMRA